MERNKEVLENQQDKQKLGEEDLKEVSGGIIDDIGKCQFSNPDSTLYLHTTERYFFAKCIHAGNIAVCNALNCACHGTPACVRGSHYSTSGGGPAHSKVYLEEYQKGLISGDPLKYIEGVR